MGQDWAPGATVARLHGMQEVAGSNPAESTSYCVFGWFWMKKEINYKALVNSAIKALGDAYGVEKGGRIYASAVLSTTGKIYTAGAYWSYTASLTLHGEQAALAHAAAHGDGDILAIVSVCDDKPRDGVFAHPCGICKQLIWENSLRSGISVKVVMANSSGKYIVKEIKDLVPYPWPTSKK